MKILISGATGLIGSTLKEHLSVKGHKIHSLVRTLPLKSGEHIHWEPDKGVLPPDKIEGMDAVIHLAGENIAGGRWTRARKERILSSRIAGTRLLADTLAGLSEKPFIYICASGINYYGDCGDKIVDESAGIGRGFLPNVCKEWEAATEPADSAGIRTVKMRLGMVLSGNGGALKKMLPPFRLGLGGKLGSGKQYMSWIEINDLVRAIEYIIENKSLTGPVNLSSPAPVTNHEFTKALGKILRRPTFFAAPAFALKLVLGEMADELLLTSIRAHPKKLIEAGFEFQFPELKTALKEVLSW